MRAVLGKRWVWGSIALLFIAIAAYPGRYFWLAAQQEGELLFAVAALRIDAGEDFLVIDADRGVYLVKVTTDDQVENDHLRKNFQNLGLTLIDQLGSLSQWKDSHGVSVRYLSRSFTRRMSVVRRSES